MLKQVFQGNGLRKEKEEKIFPFGNRENSTFLWTLTPSAAPPAPPPGKGGQCHSVIRLFLHF